MNTLLIDCRLSYVIKYPFLIPFHYLKGTK